MRCPLCIDCLIICQLLAERIGRCASCVFIPAAEVIAVSLHFKKTFIGRCFSCLVELRCVVGCAFTVLIEDQPVAIGYSDGEYNISTDCDFIIDVVAGIRVPAFDVGTTGLGNPSLELLCCTVRIIILADSIGRSFSVQRDQYSVRSQRYVIHAEICYVEHIEYSGVDVQFIAFLPVRHSSDVAAQLLNRIGIGFQCIFLFERPALEQLVITDCTGTRIVDNRIDIICVIRFLDVHCRYSCTTADEIYGQSGFIFGLSGFHDCVYRERSRFEHSFYIIECYILKDIFLCLIGIRFSDDSCLVMCSCQDSSCPCYRYSFRDCLCIGFAYYVRLCLIIVFCDCFRPAVVFPGNAQQSLQDGG